MAGNREREEAFQLPLLMELAARNEPAKSGRGRKSEDLEEVRQNVLSFFSFSKEQRSKTRRQRSGREYNKLDNEVDYAFLQLEKTGDVTRARIVKRGEYDIKLEQWEITSKGMKRIRSFLYSSIERFIDLSSEQLDQAIHQRNGNGPEFLVLLMQRISPDDLAIVIRRSETVRELLLGCIKKVDDDALGPFVIDIWEIVRDDFYESYRRHYREALAQI